MSSLRGKASAENWVNLLEQTYSLDGDDREWMTAILRCIPGAAGAADKAAFTFSSLLPSVSVTDVAVAGGPEMSEQIRELVRRSSADAADLVFRSGLVVGTLSEYVWPKDPGHPAMFRETTGGPPDVLGIVAHTGDGEGVVLNLPLATPRRSTNLERRHWMRGAAHLGAALRLRRRASQIATFEGTPIEAIFDGSGKVHEARGAAASVGARHALRRAVCAIDKARTRANLHDPDDVLNEWEGLVDGRWSLIDKFDSDGRRYVIAVRNDPRFPDPRGLSQQERQVAEYVGLGRSMKEIAYILGVPSASAENCCRRAQAKLGLQSTVELSMFFSPQGIRVRLSKVVLNGDSYLVGASSALDDRKMSALTPAERSVLALIIAGSSNSDIGQRRSTSNRTVANQVQTIFRKFGARSRCELISLISA